MGFVKQGSIGSVWVHSGMYVCDKYTFFSFQTKKGAVSVSFYQPRIVFMHSL